MNSIKSSKPQQTNSPTAVNHPHGHPGAPATCTLLTTLRRRRSSGDYQKKTRLMCTSTERKESQVCDADNTTVMNCASTTDEIPIPASRTFQPSGSATDDKN